MNEARLRAVIEGSLGARVTRLSPCSGGDINEAFEVELQDGRRVFAKTHAAAPAGFFEAEARGLRWLAEAQALRVPEVLAVASEPGQPAALLLELLQSRPQQRDFDDQLGRGLAALHRFGAPGFGLDHDNFVGSLPQTNQRCASWAEFYREQRLLPLIARARQQGLLTARIDQALDRLLNELSERVGPDEAPARLHGDLWRGNLYVDDRGAPALIDPAVYGGHREMDLAMMRLFGGFAERAFAAYHEAHPLAEGHRERVPLYQLYPLLVHVNLFGAGYVPQLAQCLSRLV